MSARSAPAAAPARAPRLQRDERRAQLLDAAAALVTERGLAGVTMEGLAARAGVSKAVPYHHFANAEEALVELLRRELARVRRRVIEAVSGPGTPDDHLRGAVTAYLDVVVERGAVLAVLYGPGSVLPDKAAQDHRNGLDLVADLLTIGYDVSDTQAQVAAAVLVGALGSAIDLLGRRTVPRADIEAGVTGAVLALLHGWGGPRPEAERLARRAAAR